MTEILRAYKSMILFYLFSIYFYSFLTFDTSKCFVLYLSNAFGHMRTFQC